MKLTIDPSQILTCFVIMPFRDTEHQVDGAIVKTSVSEWNHIYEAWIKKAVESFQPHRFRCIRSPALPGNFIKGIVQDLYRAEIVIADLTGSRPNVYYELGIRHALQTGTIQITQDMAAVPSDLQSYYCFQYGYTKEHHLYELRFKAFEAELHQKIQHFFDNLFASDNPVSDFLGHKNAYLEERFEMEKRELMLLFEMARQIIKQNYSLCAEIDKFGKHLKSTPDKEYEFQERLVFDFFPFDLLLTRFLNGKWELMPMDTMQLVGNFLTGIRLQFLPVYQAWQLLHGFGGKEMSDSLFNMVEALLEDREGHEKVLDNLVKEIGKLQLSVTVTATPTKP